MTLTELLQEISYNLRGLDDDAPEVASDEAVYWTKVANRIRRTLYRDPKQWSSRYEVLELGTISASATPSFDLDDTFFAPANLAYVISEEDVRHEFQLLEPQAISSNTQAVYIAGIDPQVLYFTQEIEASNQIVGGTLYLPAYTLPDDLNASGSGTQTVVVEDADWLAMAVAAEIAFNDLTFEDKSADLNSKANAMYTQMTANNRRGTYGNSRKTPYDVPRISGY